MNSKFNLINLEANSQQHLLQQQQQQAYYNMISSSQQSLHAQLSHQHHMALNCGSTSFTNSSANANHDSNLIANFDSGAEGCSAENQSIINSRSGSLSSSSSVNHNFMEDESQQQGQNNGCVVIISDHHNNNSSTYDVNLQYRYESMNSHQNSIPDIIFTFSSGRARQLIKIQDAGLNN